MGFCVFICLVCLLSGMASKKPMPPNGGKEPVGRASQVTVENPRERWVQKDPKRELYYVWFKS